MTQSPDRQGAPPPGPPFAAPRSVEAILQRIQAGGPSALAELHAGIQGALADRFERNGALLLCDVAGHAAFADAAGRRIVERHHSRVSPVIDQFNGKVVRLHSDALLVA